MFDGLLAIAATWLECKMLKTQIILQFFKQIADVISDYW